MRGYEVAVEKAQADYDRKVEAARAACLKELDAAQKEAMKRGALDEAVAIKGTAAGMREDKVAPLSSASGRLDARWLVEFTSGARRTYEFHRDGSVTWIDGEGGKPTQGKLSRRDGALWLSFTNDDLERLTVTEGRVLVEHWHPPSDAVNTAKIMGVGTPATSADKRQGGTGGAKTR